MYQVGGFRVATQDRGICRNEARPVRVLVEGEAWTPKLREGGER